MPPAEVLDLLAQGPGAHVVAFVLGTLFGSFANVCIYRWPPTGDHPNGRSVVTPGSHCGACNAPVRWYDNVPIVSYLVLRGHCRHCAVEFSPRYMFVEAVLGMLFWAAYHHTVVLAFPGEPVELRLLRFAILAGFLFLLVVIAFIDLDHQLILDKMTYPAIPICYGLSLLLPERSWTDGLIGAVVGYGLIRAISDGYYLLTKRYGLGYGDGKLLAIVGALLTWKAVLASLFLGSILGSVIGVTALVLTRRRGQDDQADQAEAAPAGDDPASEDQGDLPGDLPDDLPGDLIDEVPLRHVALPFGPFLAMGAIAYAFAEPWLDVAFARVIGSYPPVL